MISVVRDNADIVAVVAGDVEHFLADVGIENVLFPVVKIKHSALQDLVGCSNGERMLGQVVRITLCYSDAALDPRD